VRQFHTLSAARSGMSVMHHLVAGDPFGGTCAKSRLGADPYRGRFGTGASRARANSAGDLAECLVNAKSP
jgi:hypothetical protein